MEGDPLLYDALLEKFETTRKELDEAEDTIRRITGRDPDQISTNPALMKWKNPVQFQGRPMMMNRKRPLFPIGKPKEEMEIDEESPDEDAAASKKPALQSTIVATPKDVKSRKDTIQEQNIDSKVTARNKRMFGMIMGTLQKFQHEEKKRKEQEVKRAEIEQKVEAAAEEEKQRLKKEKETLFITRREKTTQLRCLEKKLEIAEIHQVYENNYKGMWNFIVTKASPPIFFLPASHNEASKKSLEESKVKTLEKLKEHRDKVEKELVEIEECYKKDSFPTDKENIGPHDDESMTDFPENPDHLPPTESRSTNPVAGDPERTSEKGDTEILTEPEFEPIYDDD